MEKIGFDFAKAVEDIRTTYPEHLANAAFVDLSADNARKEIKKWNRKQRLFGYDKSRLNDFLSREAFAFIDTTPLIGLHVKDFPGSFFSGDMDKELLFTFLHETGHVVVPAGHELSLSNHATQFLRETAADLFSSLYALRHGWMTREDIATLSYKRTVESILNNDPEHTTSPALDWLLTALDRPELQNLSTMSPQDIAGFANYYARFFEPGQEEAEKIIDAFETLSAMLGDDKQDYSPFYSKLRELREKNPPHSLIHQIATKTLLAATEMPPYLPLLADEAEKDAILASLAAIRSSKEKEVQSGKAFDFNTAASMARADFPEETRNASLIDLDHEDSYMEATIWAHKSGLSRRMLDVTLRRNESFAFPKKPAFLGMHPDSKSNVFGLDKNTRNHMIFWHELGHIIVPLKHSDKVEHSPTQVQREMEADLFTSLYGLRHGWLTREDIAQVSRHRSVEMMTEGGIGHATSPALNWLLEALDHPVLSHIDSMTPQEIKHFARYHANRLKPSKTELAAVKAAIETLQRDIYYGGKDGWPLKIEKDENGNTVFKSPELFYESLQRIHEEADPQSMLHKVSAHLLLIAAQNQHKDLPALPSHIAPQTLVAAVEKKRAAAPIPKPRPAKSWVNRLFSI